MASKSFINWFLLFCLGAAFSGGCSQGRNGIEEEVGEKAMVREVDFEVMEFGGDGVWYVRGEVVPFTGKAVRRHDNGVVAWMTELEEGIPRGRVRQWNPDGEEIWPGKN